MAVTYLAGIALVKTGKILLVHPTGAAPEGTWSIPKGHQEKGEPTLRAAVREFTEETGIPVSPAALKGVPKTVWKSRGEVLMFWVINADWLPIPDVLPTEQLPPEEIDEARFVDLLEADFLLEPWMREVLNAVPTSRPQPTRAW